MHQEWLTTTKIPTREQPTESLLITMTHQYNTYMGLGGIVVLSSAGDRGVPCTQIWFKAM